VVQTIYLEVHMAKREEMQILSEFMEGLNTMIDASGQMVHQFGNIKWMAMRDMLNIVKDGLSKQIAQ
jgi:nucleoside 2-deoxyribosyltransferase